MSNLKRKRHLRHSTEDLQEMEDMNSFVLNLSGDTRIAQASDPHSGDSKTIKLKATTLAEAKLEVMQLVRDNPHLRHLEILQDGEKIVSSERKPGREWTDWKMHNAPIEPNDQPFESQFEKLEELARIEANKSAALIDLQSKEPPRYHKTLFRKETANPDHKLWRLAVANLQEEQSRARDVFVAESNRFEREQKDLSLNDDISDNEKIVPLAAVQNSEVESEQRNQTRQPVGKPAHK